MFYFRIRIVATDAGSPPMSSECEVSVTVVGGNEYAPKFDEDEANYIREDEQVSQELLHSIFAFNNVVWKCIPNCSLFLFSLVKISFNTLKIIQLIQKNFRLLLFYNFLKFIEFVSDRQHHRHAEGERRHEGINGQVEYAIVTGDPVTTIPTPFCSLLGLFNKLYFTIACYSCPETTLR